MNDQVSTSISSASSAASPNADAATHLGKRLHATRRRRRISVARAVAETKIRRDYLESMEKGDFSFEAPVYVKGFMSSYARLLKLDPAPLLQEFERVVGGPPDEAVVLAEQNALWTRRVQMPWAFRPLVITTSVLVALTTATLWTRATDRDDPIEPRSSRPNVERTSSPSTQPTQAPANVAAPAERDRNDPTGIQVIVHAAEARSWVEASSDGRTTFAGMLELGDSRSFVAQRTLELRLGFAPGVEVTVEGRSIRLPQDRRVVDIRLPDDLRFLERA